jgi:hypothetical protein
MNAKASYVCELRRLHEAVFVVQHKGALYLVW